MPTLYLTEDRALVRRDSEDCLLVQIPERRVKDTFMPARKERVPLIKVDDVVVMGEVTMTTSALHLLLEKNIEVTFLDYFGNFKGRLSPPLTKNALLRLAQHRAHNAMPQRAAIARQFVIGKLTNQRTLLQRYNRRLDAVNFDAAIAQIAQSLRSLQNMTLTNLSPSVTLATGDSGIGGSVIETILGLEGAGSAAYFRNFGAMLADPQQWPFAARIKRPATDPVNALLSFGYSMLTRQVASAVQAVGFDHYIGYLHSAVYGRPALALDLMEEFRPIIVDSVVLTVINNKMLTPADFVVEMGAYRLKDGPRKLFLTEFEKRLNTEITHPVFGYSVKYRRCIELQARLLAKFLTGEIESYPPFTVR